MDEAKAREWRLLNRAERERRVLVPLLAGTLLSRRTAATKVEFNRTGEHVIGDGSIPENAVRDTLTRFEANGFISGYVPVLSTEGRKYVTGLKGLEASLASESFPYSEQGGSTTPGACPDCGKPLTDHSDRVVRCTVTTTIETSKKGA